MKNSLRIRFTALFCILFSIAKSQDHSELQKMADDDQKSRMSNEINWIILNKEDSIRRERVSELIRKGELKTAKDHFNAGIIFQHGNDTVSSGMAVKSFKTALALDPNLNRWWYAAAVDRDLMRRDKPQLYGTQFIKNAATQGKWKRYTLDTTQITDEQRKYYHVETLAEQEEKERVMNLKPVSEIYKREKSFSKAVRRIQSEHKKGVKSEYNLNENVINSLGYQLLNEKKDDEALKIFKLNTILYPEGFNTFDSYGEALLRQGKIKKGIKNYKKSLALNPENENAKKVLEQYK